MGGAKKGPSGVGSPRVREMILILIGPHFAHWKLWSQDRCGLNVHNRPISDGSPDIRFPFNSDKLRVKGSATWGRLTTELGYSRDQTRLCIFF
jgi:hypothetical protein